MAALKKRGWDADAHEALLLCILDEIKPTGVKAVLTKVTERMNQQGWSYSYDAINQHVQKLRKNRDTSCISGPTTDTCPNSTPKKATGGRKRVKKEMEEAEDDEEDAVPLKREPGEEEVSFSTPKRGAKRQKKANTAAFIKNEDQDAEF